MKSPEEEWAEKRAEIAAEMEAEGAKMSPAEKLLREAAFWATLLIALVMLWALTSTQIPG